ncbi:MAG: hypothetical protein HXY18_09490 [Bryobacteraceae bacterium]|nr:hypothetical protein [Bryobacteraceae bacterium]
MTDSAPAPGRLVALEASHSADLRSAARHLLHICRAPKGRGGCSYWDASSIFHELSAHAKQCDPPSAKTLLILYAADLAFRLRWEIEPALAEGYTVVAAPYTRTAVLAGKAAGLSSKWLSDLFEFAPAPKASFWLEPGRAALAAKPRAMSGFPEFCFSQTERISARFDRREMLETLHELFKKDAHTGRLRRLRVR